MPTTSNWKYNIMFLWVARFFTQRARAPLDLDHSIAHVIHVVRQKLSHITHRAPRVVCTEKELRRARDSISFDQRVKAHGTSEHGEERARDMQNLCMQKRVHKLA